MRLEQTQSRQNFENLAYSEFAVKANNESGELCIVELGSDNARLFPSKLIFAWNQATTTLMGGGGRVPQGDAAKGAW